MKPLFLRAISIPKVQKNPSPGMTKRGWRQGRDSSEKTFRQAWRLFHWEISAGKPILKRQNNMSETETCHHTISLNPYPDLFQKNRLRTEYIFSDHLFESDPRQIYQVSVPTLPTSSKYLVRRSLEPL